jgi:dolichyl-phosphate-mannose-protein mannosyltransferase/DUF2993 family protein
MTTAGGSRREWTLVAAAFLVLVAVASAWGLVDRHPPEWDHANHLERAVLCQRDLAAGRVQAVLDRSSFYPPLVPCLAGVLAGVVSSDLVAAHLTMLASLGLGMASVYAFGRARHGPAVGVLAAVIFGTAPFVVFSTVRFQLDLPLAALVALVFWLAVRSDGLGRCVGALALGVAIGLGLLAKPPFPLYVLPVLVWVAVRARKAGTLTNVWLAAAAALTVSLAWYGPRVMGLPAQIGARSFRQAAEAGQPDAFSWTALAVYPLMLPSLLGAAAAVALAIGLVVAWRRRCWLELAGVLMPFAAFLMIQNKNPRYTLPILPMASVVAALAFEACPARLRRVAIGMMLVVAAVQVSATAFAVPPRFGVPGTVLAGAIPAAPIRDDWGHEQILDAITRHARRHDGPVTVSIVPNHAWFSTSNFRYYAVRDGRPLHVVRAWDEAPIHVHYMVLKTGDQGPPWTEAKSRRVIMRLSDDADLARVYPVIAELPLPDGSTAIVRGRDLATGVDFPPLVLAERLADAVRQGLGDVARDVLNLTVRVEHDATIVRGQVRRLEIAAAEATVGDLRRPRSGSLRIRDVRLVIDDLLVNPWSLTAGARFEPLDARRITLVEATIGAGDVKMLLSEMKGFRRTAVRLEPDTLGFHVQLPGPDVSGRVRVVPAAGRPFVLDADDVRVGGVPVPAPLVAWVFRNFDPSSRLAERLPVPLEIARVRITPDAIRIGD